MHGPVDAVYVHIPFCVKKCGYCDFYSLPLRSCDKGAAEDYTAHVIRESAHWPGNRYDTVYFGGGTPSLLTPGQIGKILAALAPLPGAEITLEANPGTVDLQSLKDYRAAGVNRLSLGIQSLQDRFLKLLGRIHSAADALEAYESAQKAGYENISLDMMFALPGQTLDELDAELERFFALSPAHLSIYALTWEEGTPFWEKRREGLLRPVENESEAAMFERIMEKAKACGYQHYEISNFARGRKISRHNIKYWHNERYIGLGPGAAGYVGDIRYKNIEDLYLWRERVARNEKPWEERDTLSLTDPVEIEKYRAFLGLRLLRGGYEPRIPAFEERCRSLVVRGFLSENEGRYTLTKKGLLLASDVTEEFL